MGYNCECTRPVSRGPKLTNNGYWGKDNKADGRLLTMSIRVSRGPHATYSVAATVRHGEG